MFSAGRWSWIYGDRKEAMGRRERRALLGREALLGLLECPVYLAARREAETGVLVPPGGRAAEVEMEAEAGTAGAWYLASAA
jgi:hypothetical protein